MFRKAKTHEDFNRYVARKTGSHPRIVDAALASDEDSEAYYKHTRRKVRARTASNIVTLACLAGAIYNVMTVDFGFSIHERDMEISASKVTTAALAQTADVQPVYREKDMLMNTNLPVKGGLFMAFFAMGLASLVYGKNVSRSLQSDREDLRTLAILPKPEMKSKI